MTAPRRHKGSARSPGGREAPARGGRSGAARAASVTGDNIDWLATIASEPNTIPEISEARMFGSRARGDHKAESDLHTAVFLGPNDGQNLALWIFNAKAGENRIQTALGVFPKIHLQIAFPEDDCITWPAVEREGVSFYSRHP